MGCNARAVLAAHPGLLVHSLRAHTGPRTAFLRDACGARLPPPAAYLTLSDAAFCAGPGNCLVRPAYHQCALLAASLASSYLVGCYSGCLAFADANRACRRRPPTGPSHWNFCAGHGKGLVRMFPEPCMGHLCALCTCMHHLRPPFCCPCLLVLMGVSCAH